MPFETYRSGSVWTRWDLHLHAPGTKLADSYGGGNEQNLERFVRTLEETEVQVFGITDYFSFDGYFAVVEAYNRFIPGGSKLFIPNIEFRLTESVSSSGKGVHAHVLIDPVHGTVTKLCTILNDLKTHMTHEGVELRCNELSGQRHYQQATVSISNITEVLRKTFPDATAYMVLIAANNDGLRGVDSKSLRSMSISDELDKRSNGFFGVAKNTNFFLRLDRYEDATPSEQKPVFAGSDAHSFDDLKRLSGDETGFDSTWVKADHSFRGLRQTLFEPKGRVHIGEKPTVLRRFEQDATRFITELDVDWGPDYSGHNGSWFNGVVIPFNPELTAIIGNKGSGKSAIADIIGLLGESRQHEHFAFLTDDSRNRKFRQKGYAENFIASLTWANGGKSTKGLNEEVDELKPESVKYLPQNYFENLTNEIEVAAFRKEIEKVVFSHVDESDRMEKSNFAELEESKTAQTKTDISMLKVRLRKLNFEIIELEQQADPATKESLSEELKQKRREYQALEKSKPAEVPKPDQETEEQRAVSEKIDAARKLQGEIETRGKKAVELLSSRKTDRMRLDALKESVSGIDSHVKENKEELRLECAHFGLDIDAIISHRVSMDTVDQKIASIRAEIVKLEAPSAAEISDKTDLNNLVSVPDLRNAHRFLSDKLKTLRETLSAPQRRYQRYVQAQSDVTAKMEDMMGDEDHPKPGTIKHIEQRIRYIENDLKNALLAQYEIRTKLCHSIFSSKERVRLFYESLKASVEERLETVNSEEFEVTIDASFVQSTNFSNEFLGLVNQTARGPFQGSGNGRTELETRLAEVDWNDFESVIAFAEKVIDDIKAEDVPKQVKDVKRLYDLLFSLEYFNARYELRLGGKNLNQLSPGEKGLLLLVFYLHLDKEKTPLIIDQPEDNLDNDSIFSVLAKCIREAKKSRQIILVTHNPNLAVGADAEQIVYVTLDKAAGYKFTYDSGSIENPRINDAIVKILEGSRPAFIQRRLKYQIG